MAEAASPPVDGLDARAMQRDKLAQLGELTAGLAHELNNPIGYIAANLASLGRYTTAMSGLLAGAEELIAPDRREEWRARLAQARWDYMRSDLPDLLRDTAEGAELLKRLVGDLKTLARSSATPEPASVDDCVRAALAVLGYRLRTQAQAATALAAPRVLTLVRPQVMQAAINLVVNAIQAQAAPARLRIATRELPDAVELAVEDAGPGIPAELVERVVQPFFTTKPGGTGLGLAIVARIAAHHRGSVAIGRSAELGGARIVLLLRDAPTA